MTSVADTAQAAAAAAPRHWSEQPRFVMLRSLVLPGWGQFHNHAYLKALAVAGTEGWLIGSLLDDHVRLDRMLREVEALRHGTDQAALDRAITAYNDRLNHYVSGQWLLGGVLAFALVDAYVDAHFRTFDIDFRTDPALPRDAAPGPANTGAAGVARTSARISLRWAF